MKRRRILPKHQFRRLRTFLKRSHDKGPAQLFAVWLRILGVIPAHYWVRGFSAASRARRGGR